MKSDPVTMKLDLLSFISSLWTDLETGALEEKNRRDHYTQLVGSCLVRESFDIFVCIIIILLFIYLAHE